MGEAVPARTSPTLHSPSPPTVHQLSRLALQELMLGLPYVSPVLCAIEWPGSCLCLNFNQRVLPKVASILHILKCGTFWFKYDLEVPRMSTHTDMHKPSRKFKVTMCSLVSDLVICEFKEYDVIFSLFTYMMLNILIATRRR